MVNTTSLVLGVHVPLVIVHLSVTLNPAVKPVTPLVGEDGVVMTAPLAAPTMLHAPVPTVAVLPANVKLPLLHWLIADPALDTVGRGSFVKIISSCVVAHTPLPTVHLKVAVVVTPVIVVVGEFRLVIVAVPLTTLQVPVPIAAGVADIVKVVLLHCVRVAGPALATVGVA